MAAGAGSPASVPALPGVDAPFTFNNTGSLDAARDVHTTTLLPNGLVLVAGGQDTIPIFRQRGTL